MYPVAPVRKIRIAAVYHSSLVARDTLIDFFQRSRRARAASSSSTTTASGAARYTYDGGRRAPRAASPRACTTLGLRKGDKVVFWSENRPEWIVAFWGCLLRGIVVVPIDYRASPDFLARVAASSRRSWC